MEYVRTNEVEIDGVKYTIRPLSGRFIGKVYAVIQAVSKFGEGSKAEDVLGALDETTALNLHTIILETLKKNKDLPITAEVLDEFVSQNMLKFMGPVIEVNMPKA